MRTVSTEFQRVINKGGPFYAYARINLVSGTTLYLNSQHDFYVTGNRYDHSFSSEFPIGEAVCKTITLGIDNHDDRYSEHDFDGAQIILYTEIDTTSNTVERLQEGVFTVMDAVTDDDIIEISASDNMHKADKTLQSTITYPVTLQTIVNTICTECGLVLGTPNFPNRDFRVLAKPKEMTCREMLGNVAQIAGGNALIDYTGKLVIKSYELDKVDIISGGVLDDTLSDSISGGQFNETVEDIISSGSFSDHLDYLVLNAYTTAPKVATDDVTITGVSYTYTLNHETHTAIYGTEGYVIKVDNPLIYRKARSGLEAIGQFIVGKTFRPFSGNFSPNPAVEIMDTVYLYDRKGNLYQSFITSNTFNYLGNSELSNDVPLAEKNKSVYHSNASKIYYELREAVDQEHTSWQAAVDQLETELDNASGLFETQEVQEDQSIIYYFHDKSTLAESQNIIKITSQALAISTNGGQTYPTGITVDGNAIVTILQSVGINADWITTGTLKVGGANNADGLIDVYNSDDDFCGRIDNYGMTLSDGAQMVVNNTSTHESVTLGADRITLKNNTASSSIISSRSNLYFQSNTEGTAISVDVRGTLHANSATIGGNLTASSATITGFGLNMSNKNLSDVNITGTVKSGGDATFTGTVDFIYRITDIGDGRIQWDGGRLTIKNGLITNVQYF